MTINLVNPELNFKALENISSAIANIVQPYKAQEQALRMAMSKDPELAQKLADLEAISPGSVARFAGPQTGSFAAGVEATPATRGRIEARPEIAKRLQDQPTKDYIATQQVTGQAGGTPGAIAQSALNQQISEMTSEALPKDEALQRGAVARRATGGKEGAGTVERQMAQSRYLQSVPKINELQARGTLQTEFQKHLAGLPSEFTGDMLNAAMDLPIGKTLVIPYLEAQKNARVRELAASRFQIGDRGYAKSMDAIILTNAAKAYANSKTNALMGDFIKLFGGSEEMITQYGGSSPEGVVEAKKAIDANAENKDNDLAAIATVSRNIALFDKATNEGAKLALLQNINEASTKLTVPVFYGMDNSGKLVKLAGDVTPTQDVPTRNVENTAVPQSAPKSEKPSSSSKTVTGSTKTSTSAAGATAKHKEMFDKALKHAPEYTVAELKDDPALKAFTPEEQKQILAKAQK